MLTKATDRGRSLGRNKATSQRRGRDSLDGSSASEEYICGRRVRVYIVSSFFLLQTAVRKTKNDLSYRLPHFLPRFECENEAIKPFSTLIPVTRFLKNEKRVAPLSLFVFRFAEVRPLPCKLTQAYCILCGFCEVILCV